MAVGFRATSTGYRAELDAHERRLLSMLCGDVIQLFEGRAEDVMTDSEQDAAEADQAETTGPEDDAAAEDPLFAHFRAELAGLGEDESLEAPEDPVLARLLPDASEDTGEAGQFRRLSEASLREAKIADLRAARMWLESSPIRVREEQAPILGRALNDLRLTLSVRLGIEEESDAEAVHQKAMSSKAKDTESFMAEIYTFITWLQETLFSAMLAHLPDDDGGDT
ncbi:DUF2017 family protein [Nesterenkonia cremea]|uniref:DUF2017 domain-containing protein n=1 Tax=Nesterenkonia cremea TaxID=1882340 RepID=A0A917ARP4_9MICC|nr:DUF2017 family protein [Nesterenkonia cremea]GGE67819.1 hypothetical protein GCM10011401_14030 [Nesterenkonia cremea]